jgi:hypothetical protein
MTLRPELARVVDGLLADKAPKSAIELDAIGEAIGARAVGSDEIDAILSLIERRGFRIVTRAGGGGEAALKTVLTAARALKSELGRVPSPAEIAERTKLPLIDVQHALSLARIMQR